MIPAGPNTPRDPDEVARMTSSAANAVTPLSPLRAISPPVNCGASISGTTIPAEVSVGSAIGRVLRGRGFFPTPRAFDPIAEIGPQHLDLAGGR